jgi:hypothetical protein
MAARVVLLLIEPVTCCSDEEASRMPEPREEPVVSPTANEGKDDEMMRVLPLPLPLPPDLLA